MHCDDMLATTSFHKKQMEGFSQKVPSDTHSFGFASSAQHYSNVPAGAQNVMETMNPSRTYITPSHTTNQQLENTGGRIIPTAGTSLQEDFANEALVPPNSGRKKKKKHKSGESNSGNTVKPEVMDEEGLVDATLPLLTENQGVEDLFSSSIPACGETVVGEQYLLNNSLLDQILTEKKLADCSKTLVP
ncbi:uncharacterized protein LOC135201658 isoform X2 [Macrobrachium nipponense]|uniref:uncharacterized protein LOC135201658 isoform X2 n=1 Tax=Macrobrachium nipponense TaxID=159736 RepID=UPI0030C8151C